MSPSDLEHTPAAALAAASPKQEFSILGRRGRWRDALRRRMLLVADTVVVLAATLAVALTAGQSVAVALVVSPMWLVLAKLYGLYDNDHRSLRHLTADELKELTAWAATGTAAYVAILSIVGEPSTSALEAVLLWAALVVLAPATRAAVRALWRSIVPAERALLVGAGQLEEATRRKLELFKDIHVECVAIVDDVHPGPDEGVDATLALEAALAANPGVDRVIVASDVLTEAVIAAYVRTCRLQGLKLSVVPPARGMFGTAVQLRHIADLPMIEYATWHSGRSTVLAKRIIDVAVSASALTLVAPVLITVALAVRLTSRGPVFFTQVRGGLNGEPFRMYKFRTMVADADKRLGDVLDLEQLADPMFKLRQDPRITPVGRHLRRFSLDELPQLLNVLKGDMSLVGPRPEQLDLVLRYAPEHRFRLAVKPGLTGPMQVYGRGELRFDERLAVEREYIENLSLSRDLRLMLLTIAPLVRGSGAF